MGRSIFDDNSAFNQFKVSQGFSIVKSNEQAIDYIKEIRLKKAIRKITEEELYELHMAKRPSKSFYSNLKLTKQELIEKVEQLGLRLHECYCLFEEEGIMPALYKILKLKKNDTNSL